MALVEQQLEVDAAQAEQIALARGQVDLLG